MHQQRNLMLFFVAMAAFMVLWTQLTNMMFEEPRPPVKLTVPDAVWNGLPARLPMPLGVPGLGDATQLAGQVAIAEYVTGSPSDWVEFKKPEIKPEPTPLPPPPKDIARVELGGKDFNLRIMLTSLGAGVERVRLAHFEAADWFGLPYTPPETLDLVPEDPRGIPSNLFYHYPDPDASNPFNTLGRISWALKEKKNDDKDEVHQAVFTAQVPGEDVVITKTYTLRPGDYHIGLEIKLERTSGEAGRFRYQLAGAHGLHMEGVWYTYVYRNALTGLIDANGSVTRVLEEARTISIQQGGDEIRAGDERRIGYAGIVTQYFASMIVVDNEQAAGVTPDFLAWSRATVQDVVNPEKPFLTDITSRVISKAVELKPGAPVVHRYLLYNGPVKVKQLATLSEKMGPPVTPELAERYEHTLHLNTLTDYGRFLWWSDLIIASTNLMHWLINVLHGVVPNYGVCIILLTVIVRGAMFPLSRRQMMASMKLQEQMAKIAPQVKDLEAKWGHDPLELQRKKNELYMKSGINPLAAMGTCWLLLLQMPIFMGLYFSLQESIHFRLASFLWVENLAAPDMLKWWGESIPWLTERANMGGMLYLGPFLNILPILAVVLMFVQQKMMTPPPTDETQAAQQRMMKWMLAFMGIIFYKMPAGLCIYFIASGLWGLAERKFMPKKKDPAATDDDDNGQPAKKGGKNKPRKEEGNGNGKIQKIKDWWAEVLKEASKKQR